MLVNTFGKYLQFQVLSIIIPILSVISHIRALISTLRYDCRNNENQLI